MVGERAVRRMVEAMVPGVLKQVNEVLEENNRKLQDGFNLLEARIDEQRLEIDALKRDLREVQSALAADYEEGL
jgi:hypothetical protein